MPAEVFACINIFYTLYESGLLGRGGGGAILQLKQSELNPINAFLPNKELMTEMIFSTTNLLKLFYILC